MPSEGHYAAMCELRRIALRANNDETLPYAPDTLGKQESQSWQKSPRIVSIRLQTYTSYHSPALQPQREIAHRPGRGPLHQAW